MGEPTTLRDRLPAAEEAHDAERAQLRQFHKRLSGRLLPAARSDMRGFNRADYNNQLARATAASLYFSSNYCQ